MAKIFDRSGTYYARFTHNGKDYCRSTKVLVASRSKKAAEKARADAEAELARMLTEIQGRQSADALFSRLLEAIERLPSGEREPKRITFAGRLRQGVTARLPIADAWQAWLDSPRKRNPSPATVEMYLAYWGRGRAKKHGRRKAGSGFKNWLAGSHEEVTCLHEVTPAIAEEYATHLWQSGISPRTYNGAIKFLRSMFKVLKTRAGLAANVWEDIPTQDNNTEGRRNLTPEELATVCSQAEGELRYWFAIGLYTGLRLGDVVTLKWDEIDFKARAIRRIPSKTKRKGKVVTFPLHPVLEAMLRELREAVDADAVYLFPDEAARHEKGQSCGITNRIQSHFIECGIDTHREGTGERIIRDKNGKPVRDDNGRVTLKKAGKRASVEVGFHSLRHSFVSLCAANRVPQVAIQELVGHGSPAMTELYSHAGDEQKAAAIAALPAVGFDRGVPRQDRVDHSPDRDDWPEVRVNRKQAHRKKRGAFAVHRLWSFVLALRGRGRGVARSAKRLRRPVLCIGGMAHMPSIPGKWSTGEPVVSRLAVGGGQEPCGFGERAAANLEWVLAACEGNWDWPLVDRLFFDLECAFDAGFYLLDCREGRWQDKGDYELQRDIDAERKKRQAELAFALWEFDSQLARRYYSVLHSVVAPPGTAEVDQRIALSEALEHMIRERGSASSDVSAVKERPPVEIIQGGGDESTAALMTTNGVSGFVSGAVEAADSRPLVRTTLDDEGGIILSVDEEIRRVSPDCLKVIAAAVDGHISFMVECETQTAHEDGCPFICVPAGTMRPRILCRLDRIIKRSIPERVEQNPSVLANPSNLFRDTKASPDTYRTYRELFDRKGQATHWPILFRTS